MDIMTTKVQWTWHDFDHLTGSEMHEILRVRQQVFIVEQNCVYVDADDLDRSSLHLIGRDSSGEIAAYARLALPGTRYAEPSIGRVLTAKKYRNQGLARRAVELCLDKIRIAWGIQSIRVAAQFYLKDFYRGFGFFEIGEKYEEDGIEHIDMMLDSAK